MKHILDGLLFRACMIEMMMNNQDDGRLLTSEELTEQRLELLDREARYTASIMKTFWCELPEDMPSELRSDMTMMWFLSTFMEGVNNNG